MGRFRHGRALAFSAALLGLAFLCAPGGRSFASDIYTTAMARLTSASRLFARKGPIPFVLDLSRHKRTPRAAVKAPHAVGSNRARSAPRAAAARGADSKQRTPARTGARVALFGIDAADWLTIDQLIARGQLPSFAQLKRVAATGVLKADAPLLSPLIWTTIATGRRPEDHGVLDFLVDVPGGGVAPVNGGARRVKAMWEIWSEAGRNVLVTGWWATWPADRVQGVIVSDRVALPHLRMPDTSPAGLVFPPDRWKELSRLRVVPDQIDLAALTQFVPVTQQEFAAAVESERSTSGLYRDRIAHLRAAIAATRTYERASTGLLASVRPDLWAVYYELVDTVSHLFVKDRRAELAISAAYAEMDRALADAAKALDADTVFVVVSDHGFYPADAGIREDPADLTSGATAWHRPAGIVAVTRAGALSGATPPARLRGVSLGVVSPLDILPTLLSCAGLAAARDMPGRVLPFCDATPAPQPVATYGEHKQPLGVSEQPASAKAELERLRALGYITGTSAPSSLARVNLAEILFRKGDYRGALRELEALVRADPLNARATLWLARTLAVLGRPADAVQQYDRMIQAATSTHRDLDPIAFLAATDLDVREQRIDAAAERLARVPSALAQAPEVLTARGALAEAEQHFDQAEREYRHALGSAPADPDPLERLVDLLVRTSRPAAASVIASTLARRYPSSAIHQSLAGESALAERRYRDAEEFFSKAVALEPDAVSVRVELARVRLLGDRPDAALEAVAPLGSSRDVETIRGAALSKKADWAAAAAAYERALGFGAPTVELLNGLGYAQLQAGQKKRAAATFERSLQLKPDQADIRKLLEASRTGVPGKTPADEQVSWRSRP
jgi:tetratricopeptide (TPR) repeat protein